MVIDICLDKCARNNDRSWCHMQSQKASQMAANVVLEVRMYVQYCVIYVVYNCNNGMVWNYFYTVCISCVIFLPNL